MRSRPLGRLTTALICAVSLFGVTALSACSSPSAATVSSPAGRRISGGKNWCAPVPQAGTPVAIIHARCAARRDGWLTSSASWNASQRPRASDPTQFLIW